MNIFKKISTALLVLVIMAGLIFVGHVSVTSAQTSDSTLTVTDTSADGSAIILLLAQLTAIQLDTTIFSNPAFLSLTDQTVPVTPVPLSRVNPFAPLGQN